MICIRVVLSLLLIMAAADAVASPSELYRQAMQQAAAGQERAALIALDAADKLLPENDLWRARMQAAQTLLMMRQGQQMRLPETGANTHLQLARNYAASHQPPATESTWVVKVLATLLPGAGHLWLGRSHDALTAAMMVWPLLILTLWAAKRRMGPVTVFFTLITVWLWSGTLFSAISLAERGDFELYMVWWQGLWQASGLPGRPW